MALVLRVPRMFSPRNEKFIWYVKNPENYTFNLDEVRDPDVKYPNQKKNGKLKCNPLGKNPSDVWQIPKVTSGKDRSSDERTPHPAQFPLALIERILKACSNPGDTVLDPFMGSGSLAEAALRTGRNAVGFEVRQDYVEIASRRLDAFFERRALEQVQGSLFSPCTESPASSAQRMHLNAPAVQKQLPAQSNLSDPAIRSG